VLALTVGLAGCDGGSSPDLTTPALPQPTPQLTQLRGIVYDAAWRRIAGAKVEVVQGPEAGRNSTTTDATGSFFLTGVFGSGTYFQATKEGHVAKTMALPITCQNCSSTVRWAYFYLAKPASRNVAGDYTLTFIADSACADLPNELRTRTYGATVTLLVPESEEPSNSWFDVAVTGAPLLAPYNSFLVGVAGDYVAANMGDWGHGAVGLLEQLTENTYLTLSGGIGTTVTDPSTISSSFHGTVDYCELSAPWGSRYNCAEDYPVAHSHCESEKHQLVLKRR
jgi:hypothetical protein